MSDGDETLEALVARWQQHRDRGEKLAPEALCAACPEMRSALDSRIRDILEMEHGLGATEAQVYVPELVAQPARVPHDPAHVIGSTAQLAEALRQLELLAAPDLALVTRELLPQVADPRLLARVLVQRNLLTPFQANQVFKGRGADLRLGSYVLLERLGEGGMGQVFKARHVKLNKVVALKVIRPECLRRPNAVRRFRREIQAVAQLNHPNIIRAFDADQAGNRHFLVMEFCHGIDLSWKVRRDGPLAELRACAYVRQAALGLQHAHERGLVHRDIKPANLLLVSCGPGDATHQIKLLDMGLARAALEPDEADDDATSMLTQEGFLIGTPDFIAPEQTMDAHRVDIRADLYSLGCTLFFLLTGQVPFPGRSLGERLVKHQTMPPPRLASFRPEAPPALEALILRLMAKQPEERYATPAELAEALLDLMSSLPHTSSAAHTRPRPGSTVPPAQPTAPETPTPTFAEPPAPAEPISKIVAPPKTGRPSRWRAVRTTRSRIAWAALAATGILLVGLAYRLVRPEPKSPLHPGTPELAVQHFRARADQPWQDTGIDVRAEHSLTVRLKESWGKAGPGQTPPPEVERDRRILPEAPALCLLGRVGGAAPFALGSRREWHVPVNGRLFVQFNTLDLDQLNGTVALEIEGGTPGGGPAANPQPVRAQQAEAELLQLAQKAAQPSREPLALWWEAQTLVRRYHDLPARRRAQEWMLRVTSPLDSLDPGAIPSDERRAAGQGDAGKSEPAKAPPELAAVLGSGRCRHWAALVALAWSPDGTYLATAAADGVLHLWDPASGWPRRTPDVPAAKALVISPDSRRLYCGCSDGVVRIWDTVEHRQLAPIGTDNRDIRFLALSPDGKRLAIGGNTADVLIWNLDTGQEGGKLVGHAEEILCLAFHPDGTTLASAGQDGKLFLWDMAALKPRSELKGPEGRIVSMAFSPDKTHLATASKTSSIIVWNWRNQRAQRTLASERDVVALAYDAQGNLAAATDIGHIGLVAPGEDKLRMLNYFRFLPCALAFNPGGDRVAAVGNDGVVHLAHMPSGKAVFEHSGHAFQAAWTDASSDGRFLVSSSYDGTLRLWDAATGRPAAVMKPPGGPFHRVAFHPDGDKITALLHSTRLGTWEVPGGRELKKYEGPETTCHYFAYSPDARWLALAGDNGNIWIWDAATAKSQHVIPIPPHETIQALAFRGDGQLVAAGGQGGTIRCCNPSSGKFFDLAGDQPAVALVFSQDGTHLLAATPTGRLIRWDVPLQKLDDFAKSGLGPITSMALHPRGNVLALSNREGRIELLDYPSGKLSRAWKLPGQVNGVAFAADGRHLITANANGTLYVFRLAPPGAPTIK